MGTWSGHKAKFVRLFADMKAERERGIHAYMEAVKARDFPSLQEESYGIDKGEWEEFVRAEDERNSEKQAAVSATDISEKVY
jgi:3-methyl-2-oxobutanoate hydroxymethyltransferase